MNLAKQRTIASREDIIRTSKTLGELSKRLADFHNRCFYNIDPILDRFYCENHKLFGEQMKIKINEVKYGRRYNLGNYEHEDIIVNSAVEDGSFEEVITELKNLVGTYRSPSQDDSQLELLNKVQEVKEEEALEAQTKAITPDPVKEEVKKEIKEENKVVKKKAAKKKVGAKGKSKVIKYDRNSDQHKALLGSYCEEVFGTDWKKDKAVLGKVKQASLLSHDTEDFLDGEGEILESFKEVFGMLTKNK